MSLADDMNDYPGEDVWHDVVLDHPEYDAAATKEIQRVEFGKFVADTDGHVYRLHPTFGRWLYAGEVKGWMSW